MLIILAAAIPALFGWYVHFNDHISLPFKCSYKTNYFYSDNDGVSKINLIQDLRIYSPHSAYFILTGTAQIAGKTYHVKRSLMLDSGDVSQGETFLFNIKKSSRMDGDDVPDAIISKIIHEYSIDPDTLQFDIFPLRYRTYLIGGPYSFVSTCLRY